ncbi:LysR substrate-binding domain-containing protein [Albimonas sp. CAU 1670]|uniref:LysR substrate-binding domain-containing protein n=1 Tax=Albimonas sp. CAU 1670 TaxID=3032599 RepID=UPI0023DBF00B|nr:LysR substrate-binding domain-containing protein [Albimonas sp. CAU 1670]MDF2234165.1 LysR substrate-binding domain-containing protein [Albimonas sp. CAU 1670]
MAGLKGDPSDLDGAPERGAPSTRLPPLNLFRVFEAAARHASFRLAAEELCVTPSAVSQQIRHLEEFLEIRLFRRLTRRVELTREGAELAGQVREALFILTSACAQVSDPDKPAVVTISATPAIAMRWLTPRLRAFMAREERVKITLLASDEPVDFARQDVDVAIRWGAEFPGMRAELLGSEPHYLVCAPEVLEGGEAISRKALAALPFLHVRQFIPMTYWLESAGLPMDALGPRQLYNDAALMLEAVAHGQGICLASHFLAESGIRSGRLARAHPTAIRVDEGYHVLSSPELGDKPGIRTVREWLLAEAAESISRHDLPPSGAPPAQPDGADE